MDDLLTESFLELLTSSFNEYNSDAIGKALVATFTKYLIVLNECSNNKFTTLEGTAGGTNKFGKWTITISGKMTNDIIN